MGNNIIEYKNYHAKIEFSAPDRCLYGKILGIKDLIIFEGVSLEEIEVAFHESVDDYLDYCAKIDKSPDKEYSGQFNVRIPSEIHRKLAEISERTGESLNSVVAAALEEKVSQNQLASPTQITVNMFPQTLNDFADTKFNLVQPIITEGITKWQTTQM